jgi:hypothetical protein
MVMPAWVFAHFIVIRTQLGFAFLKTLFNGPAHTAQPDK